MIFITALKSRFCADVVKYDKKYHNIIKRSDTKCVFVSVLFYYLITAE